MATLIDHLPDDLRTTLASIRSAVRNESHTGNNPSDETSRVERIIAMLNGWLLDEEQKQMLARSAWSIFYLYAAVYLGPWCDGTPDSDRPRSETESDAIRLSPSAPIRWKDFLHHRITEASILDAHQVETLAAIGLASYGDTCKVPTPWPLEPVTNAPTADNLALIAAGIHLAQALDLKAPPALERLRAAMTNRTQYDLITLGTRFDVHHMGAHPYFPGTIQVRLACRDAEVHRALKHHERGIQKLLQHLNARVNPRFLFSDVIYEIEAEGYTPVDMKFSVDSSAALQLFTGNRLYADKRTFLRELIQNAIDACHLRKMVEPDYTPEIVFAFKEDISIVTIRDNGIGMDRQWLEKYFLKIGISFYQSDEIRRINTDNRIDFNFISQFGIGFLSSFLVAEKIVIRTRKPPSRGLMITITNLRDYFDVRFLDERAPIGTEVTLHLKPSRINYCRSLEFVGYLKTNIRFLKVPVRLTAEDGQTTMIGMEKLAYPQNSRRRVDFVAPLKFNSSEGYLLLKAKQQTEYIQGLESAHGGIAIFQDGIFVTQLDQLLPEGARQNVIGRINLLGPERCELSMDRNRIFWTEEQLNAIKKTILHGLANVTGQFMNAVDGQAMPQNTRKSIINHLSIFFDINRIDDEMYAQIPEPIRAIVKKRFRDFIRIHYAHTRGRNDVPGGDEYNQKWQQRILVSFIRKAG